jgi:hypothetical protein
MRTAKLKSDVDIIFATEPRSIFLAYLHEIVVGIVINTSTEFLGNTAELAERNSFGGKISFDQTARRTGSYYSSAFPYSTSRSLCAFFSRT